MCNRSRILIVFLFFSLSVFSQQKMTLIDQKTIPSTQKWQFSSISYSYSGSVDVQIGNNAKTGILMLQLQTSDSSFYIGGTVYLFLEDGNVITCTDKNLRSSADKLIQSYYILTPTEMNILKKKKITDVRFRVNGTATPFSSPTGFFTAHNTIRSFGLPDKTFDTVTEIKQLLN